MAQLNFKSILDAFKEAKEPLSQYLPTGQIQKLERELYEKSVQNKPRIMVYGYYNAGKSTLLNALLGEAKASMADRPETDKVTPYEWKGYTLLDTPGIDAPLAHEKVANNELDKCDVVIFVLATGGAVEEKATWDAIVNIINRGRSLILIVNNKSGLDTASEEYINLTNLLRTRLQESTNDDAIVHKVPIQLINARSALKGRIENKQALIENSRLPALEKELDGFLSKNEDRQIIINSCRSDLKKAIETSESKLTEKSTDPLNQQRCALEKAKTSVGAEKVRLCNSLNTEIDRLRIKAKKSAVIMIRSIVDAHKSKIDNNKIDSDANEIVMQFSKKMEAYLNRELNSTKENLNSIGQMLSDEARFNNIENSTPNFIFSSENAAQEGFVGEGVGAFSALKNISIPFNGEIQGMTKEGVQLALEKGKEWFPKLFKGIGPKTMGKWANTTSRWAGPLVAMGTTIYSVYEIYREEKALKREIEREAVLIEDAANSFVDDLSDTFRYQVTEIIKDVFLPVSKYLDEQTNKFKSDDIAIEQSLQKLAKAKKILNEEW